MGTRRELTAAVAERYKGSNRAEKARILDEFVVVTGFHRKHAVRLLRGDIGPPRFGASVVGFMTKLNEMRWCCSGRPRTGFAASD
jgi:hypothetical protein